MYAFTLPFFLLLLFSSTTAQPHLATDRFFLNCGSSTASYSSFNQRYWDGDQHSKFVPSNINTTSSSTATDLNSSVIQIPYATARIFTTSSFTYTFPVSPGPKFLRLHFYPATYSNLKAEQSLLSVTSNGYSLLTNFSAFQAVSSLRNKDLQVVKEFLIYVKDTQILNVTFTPSPNSHAFINGIEIIPSPENLYYKVTGLNYVGMINGPVIDNHIALENMYRLNMGGRKISVFDDTGMYRSWDQDSDYIYGAAIGVTPVTNQPISYTNDTPSYSAPELVYKTQRSMGQLANTYNLTWILPVDSGFYYMLRLHFCNIIPQYTKKYGTIFRIFINNQTAEDEADVLYWTQGSRYPVFKDYIVFVGNTYGSGSKQDLLLSMKPNYISEQYLDAYLNGLEAFKLSRFSRFTKPTGQIPNIKRNKKKTPYAVIIGGIAGALVLLPIIVFVVVWQRRRNKQNVAANEMSSDRCRRFAIKEVKVATEEFSDSFIIGYGGFGKVYKGYMDNGKTIVAIKRLDSSSSQGFKEFRTEIEMLSKLRHAQLVSLIGYCDDEGEMILVYDYMAHGTLREHLYNTNNPPLSWRRRLDICIGIAKGLHYLHSGQKRAVIHGDVKSTNILLDENWVAKLSDFGLSKLSSEDHVNTVVKGSLGYVDPEYCWTQQLTKKSDVYSFGVVLLEVLCARPVIDAGLRDEQVSLVEWGKTCYHKGNLLEIVDPKLSGEIAPGCLKKFGDVVHKCLHEEGSERPAMEEVVWRLEFALQLQEDAEKMDGPETMTRNQEP